MKVDTRSPVSFIKCGTCAKLVLLYGDKAKNIHVITPTSIQPRTCNSETLIQCTFMRNLRMAKKQILKIIDTTVLAMGFTQNHTPQDVT